MNRNVSIVVIILVLVVIAGYLVWLRSRVQNQVTPEANVEQTMVETPMPTASPTNIATPSGKEATGSTPIKSESMKEKAATAASVKK